MKTKYFILAAIVATGFAGCTSDDFVGDLSPNVVEETNDDGGIRFGSGFKAVTRAGEHVGADAASYLNGKFIVSGFKGASTPATTKVFDNYLVEWTANTAGKTESNTDDWEYVGKTSPVTGETLGVQTIKYWDYSQALYDFIAYSPGNNEVDIEGLTPSAGHVLVTQIDPAAVATAAYTIKGGETELKKCYIADRVTVAQANYNNVVTITFRALTAKVRVGLYETVPGYSVKDVKFYAADGTPIDPSDPSYAPPVTSATLIGSFNTGGKYTVKYDDGQKAHVTLDNTGYTPESSRTFGNLTYRVKERNEKGLWNGVDAYDPNGLAYLKWTAGAPSYANNGAYTTVLPVEGTSSTLELRIDYTLEAIDGGEEIVVRGAKAFVPATYTQWLPNYAYTYIFKITDNSNGWTSTSTSDPAGLFPITFDAIVTDSEEFTQSTITTVATPSITTYQNGRSLSADEYANAGNDVYVQVMNGTSLAEDLNSKGKLYTMNELATEAKVLDALHIQTTGSATINGRNGVELTTATATISTTIPRADGNNITVPNNSAHKFDPAATTNYAYVYETGTWDGIEVTTAAGDVQPADWGTTGEYYTTKDCTTKISSEPFTPGTTVYYMKTSSIYTAEKYGSQPGDWTTPGIYFEDPDGTKDVTASPAASFSTDTYYYKKYTVDHQIYGVKVIKVQ